jgi:LPPG:FO 2-phospho-L-lactate transferase
MTVSLRVVALAGGVGGAKLSDGLARVLPEGNLTVIVNVGDDFEYLGLYICPDLDTVTYTLAGLENLDTGWGRRAESWHAHQVIGALGGDPWFRLGDHDLGLHLERTRRLRDGVRLSTLTEDFRNALGIKTAILPVTDHPVPTQVNTVSGWLPFQEYFVHQQCRPQVTGFRFLGVQSASPSPGVLEAIGQADLVVICPSNPWVSIDPILAVPGVRQAVASRPVLAVSPIIAGRTVKGPAAKMFSELGIQPSAEAVARHYADLLWGFILDAEDSPAVDSVARMGIYCAAARTLMRARDDRTALAGDVLHTAVRWLNLDKPDKTGMQL